MNLKYKQLKTTVPFCGECGERLKGNNSDMFPYECSCGTWEVRYGESPIIDFKLLTPN